MEIKLSVDQLDWIDAMCQRFYCATGTKISREQVLMRTLENGFDISENQMAVIEQNLNNPQNYKKFRHLKIIQKP
jgi:hypothetical protein